MKIYKIREDGVYDGEVDYPQATKDTDSIPAYHTKTPPPQIPAGKYAIMQNGWVLVDGKKPQYPPFDYTFQEYTELVQTRLDKFAQTKGYSGILSLASYATSKNPEFSKEGLYGVDARDATWAKFYQLVNEIKQGSKPVPNSFAEFEAQLPALVWPAA